MTDPENADEQIVSLITRHQSTIKLVIACLLPDPADRDDVLQETNLVLWRKREEFREVRDFKAWASTIARYQVMAWRKRRSRKREFELTDEVAEQLTVKALALEDRRDDMRAALRHCIQTLSPGNRALLTARYCGEQKAMQNHIAETGRSFAAAYKALERVRQSLRRCCTLQLAQADA